MRFIVLLLLGLVVWNGCRSASPQVPHDPYDSGGPLLPEQAAYDVTFYDLALRVQPSDSTIRGTLTATARIVSPTAWFVLDLDPLLDVASVAAVAETGADEALSFERRGGRIWAAFPYMKQPGEVVSVRVKYGGRPRIAPNPPWDGGFTWAETPSGAPWIATSCQGEGADVWWPVKDHVSDKPDSMALHITVPQPLVVATNGMIQRAEVQSDGTSTAHWFVSTPISTYNIALNIAPYRVIEETFESVAGDSFPVMFWVLREDYEKGRQLFPEILDHLRFYEETLGPYPFRADKYGVAQTPHLGMEHQTVIAYGANFDNGSMTGGRDWGFDALHHHELAHEWWGNLVTNADWSDMWLHEGFGTYMQALYAESLHGDSTYHAYMENMRRGIANRIPVAPRGTRSAAQIYGGDIYSKG
ncbi:MAG: M1 family metallopeptidase, partial [Rhodothermales bacterium]